MIRLPKMSGKSGNVSPAPQRAKATLPKEIPGQFFVLDYSRAWEKFTLRLDDADKSSHDLGTDWLKFVFQFTRVWNVPVGVIELAVDYAKEFGRSQVVLGSWKVIQHKSKQIWPELDWNEERQYAGHLPSLASL